MACKTVIDKCESSDFPDPPDWGSRVGGNTIFTKSACLKSIAKHIAKLTPRSTRNPSTLDLKPFQKHS